MTTRTHIDRLLVERDVVREIIQKSAATNIVNISGPEAAARCTYIQKMRKEATELQKVIQAHLTPQESLEDIKVSATMDAVCNTHLRQMYAIIPVGHWLKR